MSDNSTARKKVLILYGTRNGWTGKTAGVLERFWREETSYDVEVYSSPFPKNVRKMADTCDLVIAGSSIVAGFWIPAIKRFLRKQGAQCQALAVFVSAGGTIELAATGKKSKQEAIQQGRDQYISPFLVKHGLKPISTQVFGGQYGKAPKVKFNNWNQKDILHWAEELHEIIRT